MPIFKVEGIEDLERIIEKTGQLNNDELINSMLKAGSEIVRQEWVKEIRSLDLIETHNMINNVGSSKPKKNKFGRLTFIYPQGEEIRKKGSVRNAAKAFYQHYGYMNVRTGRRVPGKFFVRTIEKRAENLAVAEMTRIFENYMKKLK